MKEWPIKKPGIEISNLANHHSILGYSLIALTVSRVHAPRQKKRTRDSVLFHLDRFVLKFLT